MHHLYKLALAFAGFALAAPAAAQPADTKQAAGAEAAEQKARQAQVKSLLASLHPQTGDIRIPGADAVLHLGEDYYFLPASEAGRVLVEGWGNHPDSAAGVLGLVFPKGKVFTDDTWGAVISFEASGYVSDKDAQSADYDELLATIQAGEADLNAARAAEGYSAQHLVGWAQPPAYDARNHSVVWAQNIHFDDQPQNTLNYDVRLLGRRGVLSLNMITSMAKLEETRAVAARFARAAEYDSGARYTDFQPGDAKADYGIAGLVAAGVGVAAAKKLGLLAIILAFGKKFFILILAALALLGSRLRKRFGGRASTDEVEPADYADRAGDNQEAEAGDMSLAHDDGEGAGSAPERS